MVQQRPRCPNQTRGHGRNLHELGFQFGKLFGGRLAEQGDEQREISMHERLSEAYWEEEDLEVGGTRADSGPSLCSITAAISG